MTRRTFIQGTKFRWDRNWTFYRVNAVLSESKAESSWPEARASAEKEHGGDQQSAWTGYLLELSTPILKKTDVTTTITTKNLRVYPPFSLNKKSSITHSFDEVSIPSYAPPENRIPIPNYAVKGVLTEFKYRDSAPMYGLRIDCSKGVELDEFLSFFLGLIRQYTKQWWVTSPRNPFDAGLRMAFELRENFTPREPLLVRGAGEVPVPWYGSAATQTIVGFERSLDAKAWNEVATCVTRGQGIETALQFFLDAVDDYMGYQDRRCILNLALLFEVCENKCLLMEGRPTKSRNKELLRTPILAKGKLQDTFRKIVTDRDNIAHGRPPHHYSADFSVIVEYLEASSAFINLYLERCRSYGWEKAIKLSI